MRVGTRIKELCAALEGMDSATAAEIHQAVFPELDVNSVRTYCSRAVGLGFASVDRNAYPMRFAIADGWHGTRLRWKLRRINEIQAINETVKRAYQ